MKSQIFMRLFSLFYFQNPFEYIIKQVNECLIFCKIIVKEIFVSGGGEHKLNLRLTFIRVNKRKYNNCDIKVKGKEGKKQKKIIITRSN